MNTSTSSPWSKGLIGMTIFGITIIIGGLALMLYAFNDLSHFNKVAITILIVIIVTIVVTSLALMPKGVSINEKSLTIHLLLKKIIIPLDEIDSISAFHTNCQLIRVVGVGGLFGYVGIFKDEKIGKFDCYVTDFNKSYVIYRKNKRPIVVSVANPAIFEGYKMTGKEVK